MRIVIAAGGGGHFSPALSVIEQLPKEIEVLLIGRKHVFEGDKAVSLEYQVAKDRGIPFRAITTGRLQRHFTRHSIPSLLKIPQGFFQAVSILRSFQPEVVVSFGGYVALPVVLAAALLHIPIVIHEQTLDGGMTNKISSTFAHTVCISWEQSRSVFPSSKTVLTGNPLRGSIITLAEGIYRTPERSHPLLYVTGGSSGSHALNVLLERSYEQLLDRFSLIHQTGDAQEFHDFERLTLLRESLPQAKKERYHLVKFLDPEEVGKTLLSADIVISRSGINTMTELLYLGKPSLLIPLPHGQNNEQLKNALFLTHIGLAEVLEQKDATAFQLLELITKMAENIDSYQKKSEDARHLVKKDAAAHIVHIITDIAQKKSHLSSRGKG